MRAAKSSPSWCAMMLQRNVAHVEEVLISCWFLKTRAFHLSHARRCVRKRCSRAATRAIIA
jgi:hypothetical protein